MDSPAALTNLVFVGSGIPQLIRAVKTGIDNLPSVLGVKEAEVIGTGARRASERQRTETIQAGPCSYRRNSSESQGGVHGAENQSQQAIVLITHELRADGREDILYTNCSLTAFSEEPEL